MPEGRITIPNEITQNLKAAEDGFSPEKIAKRLKVSLETVEKWLEERLAAV